MKKHEKILAHLNLDAEVSDRSIAQKTGTSHVRVGQIRRAHTKFLVNKVKGRDDKFYRRKTTTGGPLKQAFDQLEKELLKVAKGNSLARIKLIPSINASVQKIWAAVEKITT